MSLGPVYARHSAGDTNEPEAAQTQSGGETFHAGPFRLQAFDTPESAQWSQMKLRPSGDVSGQGALRRWVLSGAAGGSRGVRCEANVSPGIQPGDRQHSAGKVSAGEGAGTGGAVRMFAFHAS
jgi:hypothetical protein